MLPASGGEALSDRTFEPRAVELLGGRFVFGV